jgi:hypothetical protein
MNHNTTDIRTEREKKCIEWLESQEDFWIDPGLVKREFPDVVFDLSHMDSGMESAGYPLPVTSFKESIRYGHARD